MQADEHARRYAFLVGTAVDAATRAAHEGALRALSSGDRATVVAAVRDHTLAGTRLTPDDITALARLVVAAERRRAGLVESLPTAVRWRLYATVLAALPCDDDAYAGWEPPRPADEDEPFVVDRGWDAIDDNQVYRFTHHSQEVIGGRQAVFRRRGG